MNTEKPYRLVITLSKYHENLLRDISKSEGLSCAEILRLGLIDFHVKVQIKNNPNPFKVIHGKKFQEPQTLEECLDTTCVQCSYSNGDINKGGFCNNCEHIEILKDACSWY